MNIIKKTLNLVNKEGLEEDLFYISKDPIPYRKLNLTLPGHEKNTLYEADDYIQSKLESWGYEVEKEGCQVQAFRMVNGAFSGPSPEDPWYIAYNLYAKKLGSTFPNEIIVIISHKDSQSWVDSPGAYDNAVGTVANMEIARVLANYESKRSIWFLFCNEEHTPWTSNTAAGNAKERGDNIIAIINIDSIGGKPQDDIDTGLKTNVAVYTTPEGEKLADLMADLNDQYKLGLVQSKRDRGQPGNDDGVFIKTGYPAAVHNVGSEPYRDPNYHGKGDIPERVDIDNVYMSTKLNLAACLWLDMNGYPED